MNRAVEKVTNRHPKKPSPQTPARRDSSAARSRRKPKSPMNDDDLLKVVTEELVEV